MPASAPLALQGAGGSGASAMRAPHAAFSPGSGRLPSLPPPLQRRYGFNPGSNLVISSAVNAEIVGRVAVITTLGGASSGLFTLLYKYLVTK